MGEAVSPFLVNEAPRPLGRRVVLLGPGVTLGPLHMLLSLPQIDLSRGALLVHICLGWNFYLSTVMCCPSTARYTIAGAAPRDTREIGRLAGGGSGHLLL